MAGGSMMRVRGVASTVLSGTASVLGVAAAGVERAAQAMRPADGHGRDGPTTTAEDIAEAYDARGRVRQPSTETIPRVPVRESSPPTHVAEIAERPAGEVTAAVTDLSTDELRLLLEHERANKNRKTVIAAIERAAEQHAGG